MNKTHELGLTHSDTFRRRLSSVAINAEDFEDLEGNIGVDDYYTTAAVGEGPQEGMYQ